MLCSGYGSCNILIVRFLYVDSLCLKILQMRKTTHLELAIICYLLTFAISNSLVARENSNPTYGYFFTEATHTKILNGEVKTNTSKLEESTFNFNHFKNKNYSSHGGLCIGGTISGSKAVCTGTNSGSLAVSGNVGIVKEWRKSTDGINWTKILNTTPVLTYSNLTVTTKYVAVTTNGVTCTEAFSTTATITVDKLPIGGILNFEGTTLNSYVVCFDAAASFSKKIELKNYTGSVKYWEKSTNGVNWTNIGNSGSTTFNSYNNLAVTTLFRAIVESGTCGETSSKTAIVSIIPDDIKPTPVKADFQIVCIGQSILLTSQSGYASGSYLSSGYFDDSNPEGWIINGDDKQNFPGAGNNTKPSIWSLSNDHPFDTRDGSKVFDSKDKKFAIVSGQNYSTMETPIFNTLGLSTASMSFDEAFIIGANTTIKIEISVDGGKTYTGLLRNGTYGIDSDGVARTNNYSDFSNSNQTIDLTNYVGQNNLRVRFTFDGRNESASQRSIWAIDGISFPNKPIKTDIVWRDENGVNLGNTDNISITPAHIGINTFNVTSFIVLDGNGLECHSTGGNTSEISVFVYDSYSTIASAEPIICGATSVKLQGAIKGKFQNEIKSFPAGDSSTSEWKIISGPTGGTFTDSKDPNSVFNVTASGTYTLRWEINKDSKSPCIPGYTDLTLTFKDCTTIDFDGTDDYVNFGNNFTPSSSFSFETWIKPNASFGAGKRTILSKSNISSSSNKGYQLYVENFYPIFEWNTLKIISPYKIGSDRWYHIAVISDGAIAKLYIDGIEVKTSVLLSVTPNNYTFLIGASNNSSTPLKPENYFYGWMEELRIWNIALTPEQLRMMMNQKIKNVGGIVTGEIIPLPISNNLSWSSLLGYYQLESVINGHTSCKTSSTIKGKLINITTAQQRTAPLPYISKNESSWFTDETWLHSDVWDAPNSKGVDGTTIDWNIAKISHNINSGGKDITLLGLLSESNKLTIAKPGFNLDENNPGQGLTINKYLKLDGVIDLVGESQLIQSLGSVLDDNSSGYLERDQQGTASSYNYNYWSSPVVPSGSKINSTYTISGIMMDGTNTAVPKDLSFGQGVTYADGALSNPRKISTYWIYKFLGEADEYAEWKHIGPSGSLNAGEGYTMKGTSGDAAIETRQNYVFKGKPNNGDIKLAVGKKQNYLIGNPYPSALDAKQFILDNLVSSGGNNTVNVFNGALYFWDHFGGKTHTLREYVGGYATYNLLGGVRAIATDDRINSNTGVLATKTPGRYISVGQGFFVNTLLDEELSQGITVNGGNITFKNSQRIFKTELDKKEGVLESMFLSQEKNNAAKEQTDEREKIRISFKSPKGYERQLLVGADPNASNGFDLGYDAPMNEYNAEDMFWVIGANEFVIQGVSNFDADQVLPVGYVVENEGEILIKIDSLENINSEKRIYLKDKLNNVIHDLRKAEYKSTSVAGYFQDRFEIVFFKEAEQNEEAQAETDETENTFNRDNLDTSTSSEEEAFETNGAITEYSQKLDPNNILPIKDIVTSIGIKISHSYLTNEIQILNPSQIKILDIQLYNIDGGLVKDYGQIENSKEIKISVNNYSSGVYIIKCYLQDQIMSKRIIIRN